MNNHSSRILVFDGPAGSGKTTLGQALAKNNHWGYLDTGHLYRLTAYLTQLLCPSSSHLPKLARACSVLATSSYDYNLDPTLTPLVAQTTAPLLPPVITLSTLNTSDLNSLLPLITKDPLIRTHLTSHSRLLVSHYLTQHPSVKVVATGRDCGTNIWPRATHKFYLEAPPELRIARKLAQQQEDPADLIARDLAVQQSGADLPAPDATHLSSRDLSLTDLLLRLDTLISPLSAPPTLR